MSPSTRPSLTKPRKSQLILEGTAALTSAVLLAWLLLWFVKQHSNASKVVAYHVPLAASGPVPHLEADAIGLVGAGSAAPLAFEEIASRVTELAGRDGPMAVVSIAAPLVAGRDEWDVAGLIKKVAKAARRDILILLDVAQVDSDREAGVFGNAPLRGLRAELEKATASSDVFVLCSSEPGQKSWMIDGLGRSAFSYFVQAGLAGAGRPDDGRGRRPALTVDGLHRFVLRNTAEWVKLHRRGAIQTPMLVKVGGDLQAKTGATPLPPLDVKMPTRHVEKAIAAEPKGKDAPAKPAADDMGPTPKAREASLAKLLGEWGRHRDLQAAEPAPYRFAPARWREYESQLLRAERLVRASWNDPTLRSGADDAVDGAVREGGDLKAALAAAGQLEERVPFHPARGSKDGERLLNGWLKSATGRFAEGLERPAAGAPTPAKADAAGSATVSLEKVEEAAGAALGGVDDDRPARYLELQLPAWAVRFHEAFGVDTFKDDARGALLREAVLKRLPAETALALDRRGLPWIEADVRAGDALRREVQDALFAVPGRPGEADALGAKVGEYGRIYASAAGKADRSRRARSLYESIAARLPAHGESAVLDGLRAGPDDARPDPVPARVAAALDLAGTLGDALGRPERPTDLDQIVERASAALEALEAEDRKAIEALADGDRGPRWPDLDDALSNPLIDPRDRKTLLEKVVKLEAEAPELKPDPAEGAEGPPPAGGSRIDPGFRRKALGLAGLDARLRRLASDEAPAELDKLDGLLGDVAGLASSAKQEAADAAVLDAFAAANAQFQACSRSFASRLDRPGRASKPSEDRAWARLRATDRDVRFRAAGELRRASDPDRAARTLEAFARRESIRFHASRLALDFARGVDDLNALADREYPPEGAEPIRGPGGTLVATLAGGPVAIDPNSRRARFAVGVARVGAGTVPAGRAFVGVRPVEPTPGPVATAEAPARKKDEVRLAVSLEDPAAPPPSKFAGGLVPVDERPHDPLAFLVEQETNADRDGLEKSLAVKVFYRGRVDEDAGKKQVTVVCRDYGSDVAIGIRQDRAALARRYTQKVADAIVDQFEEHPGKGFLHSRGQLDFILSVRNRSPGPRDLTLVRSIKRNDGVELRRATSLRIGVVGSQEEFSVAPDRLTHDDLPVGKTAALGVKVLDATGAVVASEEFSFEQLPLEQYLSIDENPNALHKFPRDQDASPAFQLTIARKPGDPVTEPILCRDIKIGFNGRDEPYSWKDDDILPRTDGSNTIVASYKYPNRVPAVPPWDVRVSGQPWKK